MRAKSNGIELEYDDFGDAEAPAMLLISGLGSQMITWREEFCEQLASRGFHVIRFDNRDVGLSTKIDEAVKYALEDMADDAVGILDFLEIDRAHIVGVSMGGMIAQTVAIRHPSRVLSLTSLMSTTGETGVSPASPEAARMLVGTPANTREERIDAAMRSSRVVWGDTPEFPFDEESARWRAEATVDRAYTPLASARHLQAIQASGDRTPELRKLRVPTVVIHGDADPLVGVGGGHATAAAIPGAELVLIKGMGHVVDRRAWPTIIDAITKVAARAGATA